MTLDPWAPFSRSLGDLAHWVPVHALRRRRTHAAHHFADSDPAHRQRSFREAAVGIPDCHHARRHYCTVGIRTLGYPVDGPEEGREALWMWQGGRHMSLN
jgi:hypothetical protein